MKVEITESELDGLAQCRTIGRYMSWVTLSIIVTCISCLTLRLLTHISYIELAPVALWLAGMFVAFEPKYRMQKGRLILEAQGKRPAEMPSKLDIPVWKAK